MRGRRRQERKRRNYTTEGSPYRGIDIKEKEGFFTEIINKKEDPRQ